MTDPSSSNLELLIAMTMLSRLTAMSLFLAAGACAAGNAYLPNSPGGANSDLSGPPDRERWLAEHPETTDDIREAILEGVFILGMTIEHRDVISNSDRRGTTGNGYWRSRDLDDQVRYQWFVAAELDPFDDGRGRTICELVFVDELLSDVHYCEAQPADN